MFKLLTICLMTLNLNLNNYIKNIIVDYDKNIDITDKNIDPYYFDDSDGKVFNYFYTISNETKNITDLNMIKLFYYNLFDKSKSYIINNQYYKNIDISFKKGDILISYLDKKIELSNVQNFIIINEKLDLSQKINKNLIKTNYYQVHLDKQLNELETIYCMVNECKSNNDILLNQDIIKHNFNDKKDYLKYEGISLEKVDFNYINEKNNYVIVLNGQFYPLNLVYIKNNIKYIEYCNNQKEYINREYNNENIYKINLVKTNEFNSINSDIDWFIPEPFELNDKLPCVKVSNISLLTYLSNGTYEITVDELSNKYNLMNKTVLPKEQYLMLLNEIEENDLKQSKVLLIKDYPTIKELKKELSLNHIISIIIDLNKLKTPLEMENKIGDPSTGHVTEYHSVIIKGIKEINDKEYFELYNLWPLKNPYDKEDYYYKDYYIEVKDLINCIHESYINYQYIVAYKD